MIIDKLVPWMLLIGGFVAFFFPRFATPHGSELTADQITAKRADLKNAVRWYPLLSLGYFIFVVGLCVILAVLLQVRPYPEGLSILGLFWSGLGIGESVFAMITKVVSLSNRLQYRYLITDEFRTVRLLRLQLLFCGIIAIIVIVYLFFHSIF